MPRGPKIGRGYATSLDRRTRRKFVVACEGEKSEEIYLRFMTANLRRVEVVPLSTGEDGHSAPQHILERVLGEKRRFAGQSAETIEFWMVFDVDHHFVGRNAHRTHKVISEAARHGISVALSNPCFELWLLLHLEEAPVPCSKANCETRLRAHLKGYQHNRFDPTALKSGLRVAIERARALDDGERVPPSPATQLHLLLEAILNS